MRDRVRWMSATGKERDAGMVRIDFNTAERIGEVRYGRYFIFYRSMERWLYIDYNDIVWAYRRLEDVEGKLCGGNDGLEVHTLMIVTLDAQRVGIPVGSEENAVAGLHMVGNRNQFVDMGYTREKEAGYLSKARIT